MRPALKLVSPQQTNHAADVHALIAKLQDENRWLRQELEDRVPFVDYRGLKKEIARKRDELQAAKKDLQQTQKLLAAAIQGSGGTSK